MDTKMEVMVENNTDLQKLIADIMSKVKTEKTNLAYANFMVIGKTGSGKSTLINGIFRESLAETGLGEPVTPSIRLIEKEGFPIRIYDTVGLELNSNNQQQVRKEINKIIRDNLHSGEPSNYIHLIYYCINCAGNRIESSEIEWIDNLLNKKNSVCVPVILVLTQCISKPKTDEFMQYIQSKDLNVRAIISVLAEDYKIDNRVVKSFGLNRLIKTTINLLPEAMRTAFISSQKVSIEYKTRTAQRYVSNYSKLAFATGFTHVPVSQTPLLIAAQTSMLVQITNIFGMNFEKSMVSALMSALAGTSSTAFIGKNIVTNLLKLLPCSIIVQGTISASTAYGLTLALGNVYIKILEMVSNNEYQNGIALQEKQIEKIKDRLKTFFSRY